MKAEPAAVAAVVVSVISVLTLLVFKRELSQEESTAIVVAVTLIAGFFVRSQVTPVP